MADITMTFAADGYSQAFDVSMCSYIAVQVRPDDSATWKIQGSMMEKPTATLHWFDIDDDDGVDEHTVDDPPVKFDVDKYVVIRVWASDPAKATTLHLKRLSGI